MPEPISVNENTMVLAAFVCFFGLAFVLPSVRVWRQTGHNPYVLPTADDAYGFVSRCMKLLIAVLLAYTTCQAIWPGLVQAAGLWAGDGLRRLQPLAWAAMACALLWTVCAQFQMGRSWRIGIDTERETTLVTHGLFAWSRNPIFLAMRVSLGALTLLQPNAVTLTLFVAGDVVMQFQVRLEEAYLRERHGVAYAAYCRQVRRWL